MNIFKTLFVALTVGVIATPSYANVSNHDHHLQLAIALRRAGLKVRVNVPGECDTGYGYYNSKKHLIMICQTDRRAGNAEVAWSEEDYDTLRHEAHHFIQDCMVSSNHDGVLGHVYTDPTAFIENMMHEEDIRGIVKQYRENGADDETIMLELEAFSVGSLNDPLEQVRDIEKYCM